MELLNYSNLMILNSFNDSLVVSCEYLEQLNWYLITMNSFCKPQILSKGFDFIFRHFDFKEDFSLSISTTQQAYLLASFNFLAFGFLSFAYLGLNLLKMLDVLKSLTFLSINWSNLFVGYFDHDKVKLSF